MIVLCYFFYFYPLLLAQPIYHPAVIMKRQATNSFTGEEAYISFVGCGADNKSLIDQLPSMKAILLGALQQIEDHKKEIIKLQGGLARAELKVLELTRNIENMTNENQRTRQHQDRMRGMSFC